MCNVQPVLFTFILELKYFIYSLYEICINLKSGTTEKMDFLSQIYFFTKYLNWSWNYQRNLLLINIEHLLSVDPTAVVMIIPIILIIIIPKIIWTVTRDVLLVLSLNITIFFSKDKCIISIFIMLITRMADLINWNIVAYWLFKWILSQ